MAKSLLIIFVLFFLVGEGFAHPGRTGADGCHVNKKTNRSHCHKNAVNRGDGSVVKKKAAAKKARKKAKVRKKVRAKRKK